MCKNKFFIRLSLKLHTVNMLSQTNTLTPVPQSPLAKFTKGLCMRLEGLHGTRVARPRYLVHISTRVPKWNH